MKRDLEGELIGFHQLLFAGGSAAFTILERMIILYAPFYFLPPVEYQINNLISTEPFWGIFTVMGIALITGRFFDGLADPIIAALSYNCNSSLGRRKPFLIYSSLPLTIFTILIFFPPYPQWETFMNGIWLGVMMSLFYISFTAYVNPYLALISDLNINDENRINLSTKIALFGLLGMVLITAIFPNIIISLQDGRMGFRASYQITIIGFSLISLALLISAALSFNEQKHSLSFTSQHLELFTSLKSVFSSKAFSAFIIGEMFLQFAMNIFTMGMMYYGVVIFRQGQGFITILAGLIIAIALIFFPIVNISAKKYGKIKVILMGVLVFNLSTLIFFSLSFVLTGIFYYLGLIVIALSGFPLAVLTILINPIIAEMAINHALITRQHKGAMFFGARAIPLKATIALAGAVFAFLLSAYGKDISKPLGVQLSILVASLSSFGALFFFYRYKSIVENYSIKNYKNINRVEHL